MRALLPAGDLVMMRKQLLTLRQLAEHDAANRGPTLERGSFRARANRYYG